MKSLYKPKIGVGIIRLITDSLYADSRAIFREYIQNASDSLNEAVRTSLISPQDGHILIKIDSAQARIEIADNGTGVSAERIDETLLDIACSPKDGQESAGQFGIGRLVGAGYCRRLIFETSYQGEALTSIVSIDTEKLRQIASEDNKSDAIEAFSSVISSEFNETQSADSHYFKVILEGVNEGQLLDVDSVESYLQDVAPIDYSSSFKSLIKNKSPQLREKIQALPCVNIYINNIDSPLRKKYKCKNESQGDEILGFRCFEIQDKGHNYGWGWVAITNFSGALRKCDEHRYIRLRIHNIQIGDSELLSNLFKEARGNSYFVGEIHITSPAIHPTTARDGLEKGAARDAFENVFRNDIAEQLVLVYHRASKFKGGYANIHESTELGSVKQQKEKVFEQQSTLIEKDEKAGKTLTADIMSVARDSIVKKHDPCKKAPKVKSRAKENIVKHPENLTRRRKPETSKPQLVLPAGWEPLKDKYSAESIILVAKALHGVISTPATLIISGGKVLDEAKLKELVIANLAAL